MSRIVIETRPGEMRAACVNQKNIPINFLVERDHEQSLVGGVYLGRVLAVRKNIGAAFVDIGIGYDGFLNIKDAEQDMLGTSIHEGAGLLVQVTRNPEADKGPALTMRIDLAGLHMVMTPGKSGIGISKRITDDEVRDRIRASFDELDLDAVGLVVRTAAQNADKNRLNAEAKALSAHWQHIQDEAQNTTAPAVIVPAPTLASRVIRDSMHDGLREIVVDSARTLKDILVFASDAGLDISDICRETAPGISAFDEAGIADAFEAALSPDVLLPRGGSLIISETPAMTTIDVNAGKGHGGDRERLALEVNLEAATAVAHALRQRSIGGLIAIDFLRMEKADNKDAVLAALRQALSTDPRSPRVGAFSPFGLVDVVCRRDGKSLGEIYLSRTSVKKPVTVALDALAAVQRRGGTSVCLHVCQTVKDAIIGPLAKTLKDLEDRLGFAIRIEVMAITDISDFEITDDK